MNLIDSPWIPVFRKDGSIDRITPAGITNQLTENPALALAYPRPDFNGSMMQFLIGLLQTAFAPRDEMEWQRRFDNPPSPDELQAAFARYRHAFELDGDGPRFMQDLTLKPDKKEEKNIEGLLMDGPGDQTLKLNKDFFIKRGPLQVFCPFCAAAALFTLQTNAPSGGAGHRTSLRGGGPLTMLVSPDQAHASLWSQLWPNVLKTDAPLTGDYHKTDISDIFPWMAASKTSEAGQEIHPQHCHPYQMYWAMPRRIRLDLSTCMSGNCALCGEVSSFHISSYFTKNYGPNYKGGWLHPLSPYYKNKEEFLPFHAKSDGICYRHWPKWTFENPTTGSLPPSILAPFRGNRHLGDQLRLRIFGYETENMKVLRWHEAIQPLYLINDEHQRQDFGDTAARWIKAVDECKSKLFVALKNARCDHANLNKNFYILTESDFFDLMAKLAISHDRQSEFSAMWRNKLKSTVLKYFDDRVMSEDFEFKLPTVKNNLGKIRKYLKIFLDGKKGLHKILELA